MHNEQLAIERKNMQDQINALKTKLQNMHIDFAKCAETNISPCFFCANDETCNGVPEDCKFVWAEHM